MAKRKQMRKNRKKLVVKKRFVNAITNLRRMKAPKQRAAIVGASNDFIRDVSGLLKRIRKRPDLVKPSHQKVLKRHKKKLQRLVQAKTPIRIKRQILSQKGGIIPALIPVIVALIGAGGSIAGAATSAAILKN